MGAAWMVPGSEHLVFPWPSHRHGYRPHGGKSLISTMRHGKFGNVDYRLGFIMAVWHHRGFRGGGPDGHVAGTHWLGGEVVRYLYLVLLALIAWMVFAMWPRKNGKTGDHSRGPRSG